MMVALRIACCRGWILVVRLEILIRSWVARKSSPMVVLSIGCFRIGLFASKFHFVV